MLSTIENVFEKCSVLNMRERAFVVNDRSARNLGPTSKSPTITVWTVNRVTFDRRLIRMERFVSRRLLQQYRSINHACPVYATDSYLVFTVDFLYIYFFFLSVTFGQMSINLFLFYFFISFIRLTLLILRKNIFMWLTVDITKNCML